MFDVLREGVRQRRLKNYVPLYPMQAHADAKERLEFVMSLNVAAEYNSELADIFDRARAAETVRTMLRATVIF
ncbi:hypothetical protein PQR64_38335, partial [Paraburkholderia phytofirmans]|uniref:hypothetical protein n=1 Tax=Paraburkholderia phytofirmans TaxID=261302 RepID=UPI0038B79237